MTLFASADLLADFKFHANRGDTDASLTDAQIYRLLTLAQQHVAGDLAALFPKMLMGAPVLMTTTDAGLTYQINANDEDGEPVTPFGHAEVYAKANGRELWGSMYGSQTGDVVFEGNKIRLPRATARTFESGPYIRYVAMPGTLGASNAPTLRPPDARPLVTYRALIQWANRGGLRDPRPYQELYDTLWASKVPLYTTQYKRSADTALAGQQWWRWWMSNGGQAATEHAA